MEITQGVKRLLLKVPLLAGGMMLVACAASLKVSADSEAEPGADSVGAPEYIGFESAPVRPIARSSDGRQLLVTNTANHSLEIYAVADSGQVEHRSSVPVGLEPVAVSYRNDNEAWVVNHISDSVSIVRLDGKLPYVSRTLLVGDEPKDIVFANDRAFVATAHRGQHRSHFSLKGVPGAGDPKLHESGVGRADLWVFDPAKLGDALGGRPLKILSLFGDSPRALAVSRDQSTVYAAVHHSGNQTSVVHEAVLCYGFTDDLVGSQPCPTLDGIRSPNGLAAGWLPGGRPAPGVNAEGTPQPWASMIVRFDAATGQWRDPEGRNFSNGIRFSLPDLDLFAIDAEQMEPVASYAHAGTTLFNIAVNPRNDRLYVTNTEANNATRFEGAGVHGGSTVQGHIAKSRVTVIDPQRGTVKPRHLNRHINYRQLKAPASVKRYTVSTPTQMAVSNNGKWLYTAAIGSDLVAVYRTGELENDSLWNERGREFSPAWASSRHIPVSGGPSGVLLNESHDQLLVYTKYDNALVVMDPRSGKERQRLVMRNPEPADFQAGRFMLYDARRSSSNGESSCASCHIGGDTDHLAWDLGNPDAPNGRNPQPFPTIKFSDLGCDFVGPEEDSCTLRELINGNGDLRTIASMKGPMMTQTLRGISTHGHLHWRGDRASGYFGHDSEQTLDERTSFKNFIVAFEGLLGLDIDLPASVDASHKSEAVRQLEADVDKFADFMLKVQLPPNPVRNLDNSLSGSAALGHEFFHGARRSDGLAEDSDQNGPEADGVNCAGCHGVDHAKGFYGSRGEVAHGGEIQILKVPQLRNLYTRVGMFGLPDREGFLPSHTRAFQGPQVRGFGFLHDGATDHLLNFLKGGVFDNGETGCAPGTDARHGCETNEGHVGIPDETVRQGLVDYLMAFDNDLAPVVGQQITLDAGAIPEMKRRLALLQQRAETPFVSKILGGDSYECELVARAPFNGEMRGYLYKPQARHFVSDRPGEPGLTAAGLLEKIFNQPWQGGQGQGPAITFTCAVPGQGGQLATNTGA